MNFFLKKGLMFSSLLAIVLTLPPSKGEAMEKMEVDSITKKSQKRTGVDPVPCLDGNLMSIIFSYLPLKEVAWASLLSKTWEKHTNEVVWDPICKNLQLDTVSPLSSKKKVFSVLRPRNANFIIRKSEFPSVVLDPLSKAGYEAALEKKAEALLRLDQKAYLDMTLSYDFTRGAPPSDYEAEVQNLRTKYASQRDEARKITMQLLSQGNAWAFEKLIEERELFTNTERDEILFKHAGKGNKKAVVLLCKSKAWEWDSLSLPDQERIKGKFEKLVEEGHLEALNLKMSFLQWGGALGYEKNEDLLETYSERAELIFASKINKGNPMYVETKLQRLSYHGKSIREDLNGLLNEGNSGAIALQLRWNIAKEAQKYEENSQGVPSILGTYTRYLCEWSLIESAHDTVLKHSQTTVAEGLGLPH